MRCRPPGPTRSAIPTPLRLRTWANGELRQDSNTKQLIFDCFAIVEHLAAAFTLQAGDVVKVEIEGLGALENRVIDAPADTVRW